MRSPRIIIAPSCKGVLCSKILINNWLLIKESSGIPVFSYSVNGTSCSITIKAPVFVFASAKDAFTSSCTVLSLNRSFVPFVSSNGITPVIKFLRPNCSSAFLSSGWNTIIMAVTPSPNVFSASQIIVFIWNNTAIKVNTNNTAIPFTKIHARVFFIHTII